MGNPVFVIHKYSLTKFLVMIFLMMLWNGFWGACYLDSDFKNPQRFSLLFDQAKKKLLKKYLFIMNILVVPKNILGCIFSAKPTTSMLESQNEPSSRSLYFFQTCGVE